MKTFRYYWNDGVVTEIEACNELTARIHVLACRKDFGGIPYDGMIEAQRHYLSNMRSLTISKVETV